MSYRIFLLLVSLLLGGTALAIGFFQWRRSRLQGSLLAAAAVFLLGLSLVGVGVVWRDAMTILSSVGTVLIITAPALTQQRTCAFLTKRDGPPPA